MLGRSVDIKDLTTLEFKYTLPKTLDETMTKAVENNPSIIVTQHDYEVAQENLGFSIGIHMLC